MLSMIMSLRHTIFFSFAHLTSSVLSQISFVTFSVSQPLESDSVGAFERKIEVEP